MENENGWKSVYGNGILCLKAVKFASWNNSQLRNADDRVRKTVNFLFLSPSVSAPFPCMPGVPASSRTFLPVWIRMLPVCCSYVLVCYPYVLVCYSYVVVCYSYELVWCFSHDP